jgi:protein-disulfide isomerase
MRMDEIKTENSEKNYVRIPIGKFRENPWIISTIVLVGVLVGFIVFGFGGSVGGNVVSEDIAAENLVAFIESNSQDPDASGSVEVISTEIDGSMYKVTLSYQGQEIPVYVSNDGKYLISDLIPLDTELPTGFDGDGNSEPVFVELGDSPVKGDVDAEVTIVEFSDYQCPFCSRFYSDTLPSIDENYIKTGKVKLVYMDFPLNDIHPEAQKAAEAAKCIGAQLGDEGYFKMHDKLFEAQKELSVENYKKWARELGANGGKFDICLDNGDFASAVDEDLFYGQSLGVTGTPGFFVNGKLLSGAQPYSVFEQVIEAELSA